MTAQTILGVAGLSSLGFVAWTARRIHSIAADVLGRLATIAASHSEQTPHIAKHTQHLGELQNHVEKFAKKFIG